MFVYLLFNQTGKSHSVNKLYTVGVIYIHDDYKQETN